MGEVGHQEILRGTGVPFHFIYQVESRVSSYVWWRSVPNRALCDVRPEIWSGFRSVEEKSI
ncbi:hypothetical protein BGV83_05855 [Bacillus anthracis]|nr:hypothetical protein BGV83_05855 [Bacillus anthracis]